MMKHVLLIAIVIVLNLCSAQEIHFSQYMNSNQLINPALTGMFRGDIMAQVQYKDQWNSWNNGYKTYAVGFEAPIKKDLYKKGSLALGINVCSDKAGSADFNTNLFNMSLSNIVRLNSYNNLSVGFNFGYAKRSIDLNKLQWGSQYDPDFGYNSSLPTYENDILDESGNIDLSAGVAWNYYNQESDLEIKLGASLFHINKPNISLASDDQIEQNHKSVIHAESKLPFNNDMVEFSAYYIMQGPLTEFVGGAMYKKRISTTNSNEKINGELILGSYYRFNDAFIPLVGFGVENYQLFLSYDINISTLSTASNYNGGLELTFRFTTPNPFIRKSYKLRMGDVRI